MFQVRSRGAAALAALLLAPVPSVAQESDWPSRAIQIVVPYTPSTGADILARILGPKLAGDWKVAVVTENRPGASGNIVMDDLCFMLDSMGLRTGVDLEKLLQVRSIVHAALPDIEMHGALARAGLPRNYVGAEARRAA